MSMLLYFTEAECDQTIRILLLYFTAAECDQPNYFLCYYFYQLTYVYPISVEYLNWLMKLQRWQLLYFISAECDQTQIFYHDPFASIETIFQSVFAETLNYI